MDDEQGCPPWLRKPPNMGNRNITCRWKKNMGITCSFESSKIHRIQDTESDRDLLNWQVNTARLHICPGGKLAVGNSKLHQNLGWYKKYRIPMNSPFSVQGVKLWSSMILGVAYFQTQLFLDRPDFSSLRLRYRPISQQNHLGRSILPIPHTYLTYHTFSYIHIKKKTPSGLLKQTWSIENAAAAMVAANLSNGCCHPHTTN